MGQSVTLTWSELERMGGYASPVVVVGDRQDRAVAVSALAAEMAMSGATLLWVGAQHVARPLAWLPVRERRMDARPLREELGEVPWPGVNPFDLEADLLASWLCSEVGLASSPDDARARIEAARSLAAGSQVQSTGMPFGEAVEWAEAVGLSLPPGLGGSLRPRAVRERTDLSFPSGSMTVICGHLQDLRSRDEEILLAIMAFASSARTASSPRLLVLDGVERLWGGARRWLAEDVLLSFLGRGDGRVLLGGDVLPVAEHPAWDGLAVSVRTSSSRRDEVTVCFPGGGNHRLRVPSPAGLEES